MRQNLILASTALALTIGAQGWPLSAGPQEEHEQVQERSERMPDSQKLSLSQIRQIAVNVHDLERAEAFYRDKLGMKHLFTVPKMSFFDCDGIRLMLGIAEKEEFDHPSSVLYFQVEDIQEAYQAMVERGVKFEGPPQRIAQMETVDIFMAFFRDSENNLLSITSEVAR